METNATTAVQVEPCDTEQEIIEKFHELEKECIGYENYVNCEHKNYVKTLDHLRQLVNDI